MRDSCGISEDKGTSTKTAHVNVEATTSCESKTFFLTRRLSRRPLQRRHYENDQREFE